MLTLGIIFRNTFMSIVDEHDPHAGSDAETVRHLAYVVGVLVLLALGIAGIVSIVV